jgi:dTDP-4-dehydrorhamnose 3,5-epimerase-like enzyme
MKINNIELSNDTPFVLFGGLNVLESEKLTLSAIADFEYKCTEYYNPDDEGCLLWSDSQLDIDWPFSNPILSKKDACANTLSELEI